MNTPITPPEEKKTASAPTELKQRILERMKPLFKSSYLLLFLGAIIWMIFFDRYNLISQYKMSDQIEQLKRDKSYYEEAILDVDYEYTQLHNDKEELERYAREKYFMKKRGEDVFVIAED